MTQKIQIKEGRRRDGSPTNPIGRFEIEEQAFNIILFKDDRNLQDLANDYHEIVRFTVRGRTLAIVEEVHALRTERRNPEHDRSIDRPRAADRRDDRTRQCDEECGL
jgi:hypothetical protein